MQWLVSVITYIHENASYKLEQQVLDAFFNASMWTDLETRLFDLEHLVRINVRSRDNRRGGILFLTVRPYICLCEVSDERVICSLMVVVFTDHSVVPASACCRECGYFTVCRTAATAAVRLKYSPRLIAFGF